MSIGSVLSRLPGLCWASVFLLLFWAAPAEPHRRSPLPSPIAPSEKGGPAGRSPAGNDLEAPSLWEQLIRLEKSGDVQGLYSTVLKMVNLHPHAPQRGPALLKLAGLLHHEGRTAEAAEICALAASLTWGSPQAQEARLAARSLHFLQSRSREEPLQVLEIFIRELKIPFTSSFADPLLQQALEAGWQAALQSLDQQTTVPLPVLEKLLTLWELQPPACRPQGSALRLAEILRRQGLAESAQAILPAPGKNREIPSQADQSTDGKPASLPAACASGQPGASLTSWPPLPAGSLYPLAPTFFTTKTMPTWGLPAPALTAGGFRLLGASHAALGVFHPLQASLIFGPRGATPCDSFDPGDSLSSEAPGAAELEPFQKERRAMAHLRQGQTEVAEAAFQELSRHGDPFWQRLGRVRLADVALIRSLAESSP